jgi:hypothetical protein
LGNDRVSVNGANFAPDSQALADGVAVATTFVSSTSLVVNGTAAQVGTIQFAVRQPGPGAVTGNSVSASVTAAIVKVTVTQDLFPRHLLRRQDLCNLRQPAPTSTGNLRRRP